MSIERVFDPDTEVVELHGLEPPAFTLDHNSTPQDAEDLLEALSLWQSQIRRFPHRGNSSHIRPVKVRAFRSESLAWAWQRGWERQEYDAYYTTTANPPRRFRRT